MKALIVSGGLAPSQELLQSQIRQQFDLIIGADAGAGILLRSGIAFDLALGDFDSLSPSLFEELGQNREVITYPPQKDFSDTEAALREAAQRGARDIVILGATGNRLDHFLANLGLLVWAAQQNLRLRLLDDHNEIFLITESTAIEEKTGWYLSFFPIGAPVPNFSCQNVKYPLSDHELTFGPTLTVSNEFLTGPAQVTFSQGQVLVMLSRD